MDAIEKHYARRAHEKRLMVKWIAGVAVVMLFVAFMIVAKRGQIAETTPGSPWMEKQAQRRELAREKEQILMEAQAAGIVKNWSVAEGEVQVNGLIWAALPYDQKKTLAQFCSLYMVDAGRSSGVKLRDAQSGRVVCEYSANGGIRIP